MQFPAYFGRILSRGSVAYSTLKYKYCTVGPISGRFLASFWLRVVTTVIMHRNGSIFILRIPLQTR